MTTILESDDLVDRAGREASETLLLHAERAEIIRRSVVTGTVDVSLQTIERAEPVSIELAVDSVDVKRVAVGRLIDAVPDIRIDGDTTIVPVVEEVLVVEKRLMLKEEIHIQRIRTSRTETQTVILREQRAVISRSTSAQPAADVTNPPTQQDG